MTVQIAPTIVGVLNLTTDSFSDAGQFLDPLTAMEHAERLLQDGAAIVDVGAESTRPEAQRVPADEQWRRLEPVIRPLIRDGVCVSVDTCEPAVMRRALEAGAAIINDVSGLEHPEAVAAVRDSACQLVIMHAVRTRDDLLDGRAQRLSVAPGEITGRISGYFRERLRSFADAGVAPHRIIIDPGMGLFVGSDPRTSMRVIAELPRIVELGRPVLVGASRKSFLGHILADFGRGSEKRVIRPVGQRAAGTLAVELLAAQRGASFLRTHEPAALRDALAVLAALRDELP